MNRLRRFKTGASLLMLCALLALPLGALGQTPIKAPSNKFSINDDVKLGREAATEVERQLPIMNDRNIQSYVEEIGQRLVENIPSQFRHPEFRYSFKVVDARDINAFALPGGFTYVNRGLIEAASTEGELAGVMAHEISHVALRHGTAQAAKAQKYQWGALGGAVLGAIIGGGLGSVVAQGSQLGIGAYFLKFSRDYERQADLLGAQMMAGAGYDPRDLANMFRTIERESGGGGPEWLSSHPNPGNRYEAINREADMLRVRNVNQDNSEFNGIRARLRDMPRARSMQEIAQNGQRYPQGGGGSQRPVGRVEYPSTRYRTITGGNVFRLAVPENWRELGGNNSITFAPEGAYGDVSGQFVFTHGAMVGVERAQGRNLREATENFLRQLAQGNPNLRQQSGYQRGAIDRREALAVTFSNVSDVTGRTEGLTVYTAMLRNGDLFYLVGVAPREEFGNYQRTFDTILRSVQLND
ncbi:MAG TPA: M48 family metallopeptidase [Blastocatellia bacterium]|nr:M48 family metallopeptidase [Blastocatellia bacterium]